MTNELANLELKIGDRRLVFASKQCLAFLRPQSIKYLLTFPVPPSPTSTSLNVGTFDAASAMAVVCCGGVAYV